ncbi:unnamed protein product, partial [Rotaria magnacalcarata]
MMSLDRSYPFYDESRYNDRTTRSPWPITDKTHECITRREAILLVDNGKIQLLLCLGIPIITYLFLLVLITHRIWSKYCWKKDEKQTENLQHDSKDLTEVITHQDEPEDLSVMTNPKMKLLATVLSFFFQEDSNKNIIQITLIKLLPMSINPFNLTRNFKLYYSAFSPVFIEIPIRNNATETTWVSDGITMGYLKDRINEIGADYFGELTTTTTTTTTSATSLNKIENNCYSYPSTNLLIGFIIGIALI